MNWRTEAIKFLLGAGAVVNATNEYGDSALHIAAARGPVMVIMQPSDPGADINATNQHGDSALHIAAEEAPVKAIKQLLDAGADINAKNQDGNSALHVASWYGTVEVIMLLLVTGADINAKNMEGKTPSDLASGKSKEVLDACSKVPKEIEEIGKDAVLEYCRAIIKGSFTSNLIRSMFIGHFGVGKTTLVHKLFDKDTATISSTNGIEVHLGKCYFNKRTKKWHIQEGHSGLLHGVDHIIQIDFWDFAGQLIFYTTHQTFMSRRCLYFLVFNLSMGLHGEVQDEDLDPVHSKHRQVIDFLEFWIGSTRLYAKGQKKGFPMIVVIGTHKDKVRTEADLQSIKSEICNKFKQLIESGQLVVDENLFVDATNLSKDEINMIRDVILKYGQQYPEYGEIIPASWEELHKALHLLKDKGTLVITRREVEKMSENIDNTLKKEGLEVFLLYLHNIGYILYFSDTDLRDLVILDPTWIIQALRCIFTCERFLYRLWDKKVWEKMRTTGKVQKSYIEKVWKRQGNSPLYKHRQHLLLVMEKLDLICKPKIYDSKGNDKEPIFYYIPSIINASIPVELREESSDLVSMTYEFFDIIPQALYNRLIASCLCLWQVHGGHLYNGLAVLQSGRFHLLKVQKEYRAIRVTVKHTKSELIDVNICRAVRLFFSQTIHRILATYNIDLTGENSELFKIVYNDAAQSLALHNSREEPNDSECPQECTGPTESEKELTLNDRTIMQLSLHVSAEDQLMKISANLLESATFLEAIKRDYQELRYADFAFLILHEWKGRHLQQGSQPTAGELLSLLEMADIDTHSLCKALRRRDKEAFQLSPVFQIKEPSPELLDAVSDRLSNTYFHVGIELGFHLEEIKRIRMNNRNNTLEILRELLRSWLEKNKPQSKATIAWLATALLNSQSNIERLIELEDVSLPAPEPSEKTCTLL